MRLFHEGDETDLVKRYLKAGIVGTGLAINNLCNLSCTHCYLLEPERFGQNSGFRRTSRREFTLDRAVAIVDDASKIVPLIVIPAMEPLLTEIDREKVVKIGEVAGKNTTLGMVTNVINATKLSRAQVRSINDAYSFITISMESGVREYHDSIRGSNSFERAIKGLEHLLNNGLNPDRLAFNATLHPGGDLKPTKQVMSLLELGVRYGITKYSFSPFVSSKPEVLPDSFTDPKYYLETLKRVGEKLRDIDTNRFPKKPMISAYINPENPAAVVGFMECLSKTKSAPKFNALELAIYKTLHDLDNIDFRVEVNFIPAEEALNPRIVATAPDSPMSCCFGLGRDDVPFAYWRPGYFAEANNLFMNNSEDLVDEVIELGLDRSMVAVANPVSDNKSYFREAALIAVGRFLGKTRISLQKYNRLRSKS